VNTRLLLRMCVGDAFSEFSGAAAERLRRIDKRVAQLPPAAARESRAPSRLNLIWAPIWAPVRLGDGLGRAGAAEEPFPLAEGPPRARGLLDPQLTAQIEDQHRKTVGQFPAASKRGAALFVGIERADVCRERAPRRDACDTPATGLGSVFGNAKAIHG
jgi:hypothetical protein